MLDITVVLPTYNRRELLGAAVASLRAQGYPADRYEILIVSDGSTDGTDETYATPLASPLTRLVRQEKQGFGLSAARNLGIREAQGRLVMFLDDDMVADEGLVETHVTAHACFEDDVAVLGQVKPAPELPHTPFCQIVIGDICRLFQDDVEEPHFISFHMALSWQTSFKRTELERLGGYDETFRCYGWEDIEFSYRATQKGLRFFYEPRAISFHHDQRNTLATHAARVQNAARMAPVLFARHPDLKPVIPMYRDKEPIKWEEDALHLVIKKGLRQFFARRPIMQALESATPIIERVLPWPALLRRWYYGLLGNHIFIGYREGLAQITR